MKLNTNIPFTKFMYIFFAVSIAVILFFAVTAYTKISNGNVNVGIDFTGGLESKLKINVLKDINEGDIRPVLSENIGVQKIIDSDHGGNVFLLRMKGEESDTSVFDNTMNALREKYGYMSVTINDETATKENVEKLLPKGVGIVSAKDKTFELEITDPSALRDADFADILHKVKDEYRNANVSVTHFIEVLSTSVISGVISKDNLRNAGFLILFSWLLILLYVTFRFELKFAIAAIAALIHDVLITLGFILIFDFELNILVLSAILTLIGYSVNDTIVLFDRVRENIADVTISDFKEVLNTSINQTLTRTINTSASTLLAVLSIFFLGGDVIHGFAFTLLVGFLVGTYSSVFIASSISLLWYKNSEKKNQSVKTA